MKKINKVVNDKGYLIGVLNGDWIYLKKPSWDCGWYWGFGYLHFHTKNNKSWHVHTHFDSMFFEDGSCTPDEWKDKPSWERFSALERSTLSDAEMWKLLDYMKTFYTLKRAAEVFRKGGSNYTSSAHLDIIKSENIGDHINKVLLPELFKQIDKLLTVEGL